MLNMKTNAVIVTRDVYWTNKMWYEQEGSPRVKVEYVETKTEEKKVKLQKLKHNKMNKKIQTQKKVRIWKGQVQSLTKMIHH